jgi:hypothetical protein
MISSNYKVFSRFFRTEYITFRISILKQRYKKFERKIFEYVLKVIRNVIFNKKIFLDMKNLIIRRLCQVVASNGPLRYNHGFESLYKIFSLSDKA